MYDSHVALATKGRLRVFVSLTLLRLSFSPSILVFLSHALSHSAFTLYELFRLDCVIRVTLDLDIAAAIFDLDHTKAAQNARTNR